ncbi:hypothetical protein CDAR_210741, partial [Caerostris darwini]
GRKRDREHVPCAGVKFSRSLLWINDVIQVCQVSSMSSEPVTILASIIL